MKNNFLTSKAFALAVLFHTGIPSDSRAQDCYSSSGCSDYSNFGINATTAGTLEYDNYVSAFHSTVVRDIDGALKIWGEMAQADGVGSYLVPTPINAGNYPGLTGTPLKAAIGSGTIDNVQFVLLTDDNKLWTWGRAGVIFDKSLTTNTSAIVGGDTLDIAAFQELSVGLPSGVTAADVKMMFATFGNLVITTCSGDVYIIAQYWGDTGSGSTSDINTWNKVQKAALAGGGDLTGIVAARGCTHGFVALDNTGNLWTWGYRTWDGANPPAQRSAAVQMTLPGGATGDIRMIGMTGGVSVSSYYVLYEDGNLYTLGDNNLKQLGDWTTTNSQTWIQPRYTSAAGPVMDDIKWISPQEHDGIYRAINVLNESKKIFNWGQENKSNLGRGISGCSSPTASLDPGEPTEFLAGYDNNDIVAIETGGHTTMALRECEGNFGYVGHRVNGSMGDNNEADECDNEYQFATSAVQVCGAVVVDAVLNPSVEGPYYVGNSVTLLGYPSGGTYAVSGLSTAIATLADSTLTFTGTGTLRAEYTVVAGTCGAVTVSKTFNIINAAGKLMIPGNLWDDNNGDAITDAGEDGLSNGMWANLTGPDSIVIASVKINADGTYQFDISTDDVSVPGNYSVVLSNHSFYRGDPLTVADTLVNGYEYTGTNRGTTGIDATDTDGVTSIGDLSTLAADAAIDPVNFGIRLIPPVANDDNLGGQIPGTAAVVPDILNNDTDPNGSVLVADSITLVIPAGMPAGTLATATDTQGDITEITVPGEGVWVLGTDGTVTFTPEATFFEDPTPIRYSVTNDAGSTSNTAEISIDYNDIASVSGMVYNDGNGITDGVNGTPKAGVTVTLYAADGVTVVATAITAADGTYSFGGIVPADYIVSVTLPAGYINISSTDATPADGRISVTVSGTTHIQDVNFGIEQPPVADAKTYTVDNTAFSGTPPSGFPDISAPGDVWYAIPASSPDLTGTTGGAMSGTDAEDCAAASSCNTGTGTTFSIQTINSNTRIFYDFDGTGVTEIDVTGGPVAIVNFDVTKMVVWAQDGSGTSGDKIGFTYTMTDEAGAISNPVSYMIETATPLPVALLSFLAKEQNGNVLLSWVTASETGNRGFAIERSGNAADWISIGFTPSAAAGGNSNQSLAYSFIDTKPLNNNFYRLKQTDIDGRYVYSVVRQVSFDPGKQITISPNPASSYMIIGGLSGDEMIKVYDGTGKLVREEKTVSNTATIHLDGLSGGTYHVTIMSSNGQVVSEKIMKL